MKSMKFVNIAYAIALFWVIIAFICTLMHLFSAVLFCMGAAIGCLTIMVVEGLIEMFKD